MLYSRLMDYLQGLSDEPRPSVIQGPPMHDVTFESINIRLHQPYWMVHCGDCEHFFVIEQIRYVSRPLYPSIIITLRRACDRLHHSSDPPVADYPLTTQITPPLLDTCRACNKVPAVYSILGDIRLGESPFVICAPCWRWMGPPQGEAAAQVTVVPLPAQELGWVG